MAQSFNIVPNLYTSGGEFKLLTTDDYEGPYHYNPTDDTYWTYATPEYGLESSQQLYPIDPNFRDLDGYMISPYNTTKTITATLGIPEYADVDTVLDTDITELLPTTLVDDENTLTITPNNVDTDTFFQIYETIKGDIPNSGITGSHAYLLDSSLTQLGGDVLSDETSSETDSNTLITTSFNEDDFTINKVKTFKHTRDVHDARADYFSSRLNEITVAENVAHASHSEVTRLQTALDIIETSVNDAITSAFVEAADGSGVMTSTSTAFSNIINQIRENTVIPFGDTEHASEIEAFEAGVNSVTYLSSSYAAGYEAGYASASAETELPNGYPSMPAPEDNAWPTFGVDEYIGPDDITWYWWAYRERWKKTPGQ